MVHCRRTFIFSYVLERKGKACILALDDAHFAKGALADDSQQAEMVQVHCVLGSAVLVHASVLAWQVQIQMQQGPAALHISSHLVSSLGELSLRTLVGEHDGLAVALAHGGLLWIAVRTSLVMHPGRRRGGAGCRRGDKGCLRRGCGCGRRRGRGRGRAGVGGQVGRIGRYRGPQAL